jgi:hypothetical protein
MEQNQRRNGCSAAGRKGLLGALWFSSIEKNNEFFAKSKRQFTESSVYWAGFFYSKEEYGSSEDDANAVSSASGGAVRHQ